MKKPNKKSVYAITAIGAMSATLFGGIAYYGAYLTDQEKVTNTITYGSVETELEEPNWPGNGTPEVLNTMPNQEIQKNPQVENVGKNSAITFLVMEVPVKNVTMVTDEGKKGEKKPQEVFFFKDDADSAAKHENNFEANWIELTSKESNNSATQTEGTRTYVFAYKSKLAPGAKTTPIFDKIQIKNIIEGELTSSSSIGIKSYSIQDSYILDSTGTDITADLNLSNLEKIYDTFINQTGADEAREAALGKKDLKGQDN